MKRTLAITLTALIALTLTACGDPAISERVKNRDTCEAAGGTYGEWHEFGFQWDCDLDTEKENEK